MDTYNAFIKFMESRNLDDSNALKKEVLDLQAKKYSKDPVFFMKHEEELMWGKAFHVYFQFVNARKGDWMSISYGPKRSLAQHFHIGMKFYKKVINRIHDKVHLKQLLNIRLGDLATYILKLNVKINIRLSSASKFYKTAIESDPESGMLYSHLARSAKDNNCLLSSVYNLLKSVQCPKPFFGSERKLYNTILEHSRATIDVGDSIRNFNITFCKILLPWLDENPDKSMENTSIQDLKNCFANEKNYSMNCFAFKLMAICLLVVRKRKDQNNDKIIIFIIELVEELLKSACMKLQGRRKKTVFSAITIFCNWLQERQDIVYMFSSQLKTVMEHFTTLLNLINMDKFKFKNAISLKNNIKLKTAPLPEDIEMRYMDIFRQAHSKLNWDFFVTQTMTHREEAHLRAWRIIEFGMHLCSIKKSGLRYDQESHTFIHDCSEVHELPENIIINPANEAFGKKMFQLLREDNQKEQIKNNDEIKNIPPCLIPDHEALTRYLPVIKSFVDSCKFIVIIPLAVLKALDEMKKFSFHAREATRWLEKVLYHGCPFVKIQNDDEQLPLKLSKPKRGDKNGWRYYNYFKCGLFFSEKVPGEGKVRLLTGYPNSGLNLNHMNQLRNSTGIKYEHIKNFKSKLDFIWAQCTLLNNFEKNFLSV